MRLIKHLCVTVVIHWNLGQITIILLHISLRDRERNRQKRQTVDRWLNRSLTALEPPYSISPVYMGCVFVEPNGTKSYSIGSGGEVLRTKEIS